MKCEKLRRGIDGSGAERTGDGFAGDAGASAQLRGLRGRAGFVAANDEPCSTSGRRRSRRPISIRACMRACAKSRCRTGAELAGLVAPTGGSGCGSGADCRGRGIAGDGHFSHDHNTLATNDGVVRVGAPGTAVGDLQYLDKNADLFSEFDALDGQSSTE